MARIESRVILGSPHQVGEILECRKGALNHTWKECWAESATGLGVSGCLVCGMILVQCVPGISANIEGVDIIENKIVQHDVVHRNYIFIPKAVGEVGGKDRKQNNQENLVSTTG